MIDQKIIKTENAYVAILLCTYNGAKFLADQLNSLEGQTHQNWVVYALDDGSTDGTFQILRQYQSRWPEGKMIIDQGPQKGFCQNFLTLACNESIRADYYAFCDQDDFWLPNKLEVAIGIINANKKKGSAFLYCGRTLHVNHQLQPCGLSPLFYSPRTFQNAIIQNIAGGNTMVFDIDAKLLLEKVGIVNVYLHDWWLYILVTGAGGKVHYDPSPQILYRQHSGAIVGGNYSFFNKIKRVFMLLAGNYQQWNSLNIAAANLAEPFLTQDNIKILKTFEHLRAANLIQRVKIFKNFVLSRKTWRGNLTLIFGILLKKI